MAEKAFEAEQSRAIRESGSGADEVGSADNRDRAKQIMQRQADPLLLITRTETATAITSRVGWSSI
jgi:hypothetical protein